MKARTFLLLSVLIAVAVLFGCDLILSGKPGILELPDYTEQSKLIGGNAGLMDFGGKTVQIGERAILPLNIKNSGEGPLQITNIHILQTDAHDSFAFIEESFPALPLNIPAGASVNDIFIEFAPETGGAYRGKLFIETATGHTYIDLAGTGLWQLTVNGNPSGKLSIVKESGNISIDAGVGGTITDVSSSGVFTVLCEPEFLYELNRWTVDGSSNAADVDFENEKSLKTRVELNTHAEITGEILSPYVQFSGGTLQDAIDLCDGSPEIGVVILAGTYSVGSVDLNEYSRIYGGYSGFTPADSRMYKTPADRTNPTYQTILNVSGTISVSGSDVKNNIVIEGLTINKTGTDNEPLVEFTSATTAGLQYNTITGGSASGAAAVHVSNDAQPLLKYNYIKGGNTSGDNSKSYSIMVTDGAAPIIYQNSIIGGTANGDNAQSFGIYADFDCEPIVRNNTPLGGESWGISGGSAPGSGGRSYGIYIINNGNAQVDYNTINGGSGETAVGLYAKYGSYFKATHNNIFTSGGTTRIGVWADQMGRVYELTHSGLYDCEKALYRESYTRPLTNIAAVNNKFNTDTNVDSAVDLSNAPGEIEYE